MPLLINVQCPFSPACVTFTSIAPVPPRSPRFELPQTTEDGGKSGGRGGKVTCHYCLEPGHKQINCYKISPEKREAQIRQANEKYEVSGAEGTLRFGGFLALRGLESAFGLDFVIGCLVRVFVY